MTFLVLVQVHSANSLYGDRYSVSVRQNEWETKIDKQIQIVADLTNNQDKDQSFAYLVQIKDVNGVTVSLSWITGLLSAGQTMSPAQSWTPSVEGTYTAEIFVWASIDNPDALSAPLSIKIDVKSTLA
ncbi:MAG: hypothetical protein HY295_05135 [Thaumarchaeota archaeon]|nr:hypothetical protein [Nitrososphaerota archaeon]